MEMNFDEAVEKLGIEEYKERVLQSNSHGELFHLWDYILLALNIEDASWFKPWLDDVVKQAEQTWSRPESVFQHISRILKESLNGRH